MSRKVNLCLETSIGEIKIPFISLEKADLFTMRYEGKFDFLNNLIEILNLPIELYDVKNVCLRYDKEDSRWFPIRYSGDNYNVESLVDGYSSYLKSDQRRLNGYGIRNVVSILVPDFIPGCLSDRYIDLIARRYLDNSYRKLRDVYFLIKKDVEVKIDKFPDKNDTKNVMDRWHQLEVIEDEYMQYLVNLSSSGDEEFQQAAEELAMLGLDEIEKKIGGVCHPVIDGMGQEDYLGIYGKDIYKLEEATGMNIADLRNLVSYDKPHRRKR